MFLKKVKIKGFKSFASTINLKFDTPITAIVGPNGSGKSNIVDAVRWVLGEQSAKNLRGSEMSDVIFAGSEKLSPANSAEVSLFLDNTERILDIETDEVKISREVTTDGSSDYLINDSKCRLKDVNELLMDTGLGNNSYSIVGQGKITQIINSKPENLRELFEEAAGISKYKARKKDAEKRLENTNSNLQRIKDLVWELEKQFDKVKKEAEKAREYKKLKEKLKDIEINLLLDQYDELSGRLSILEGKKNDLEEEIKQKEKLTNKKKDNLHRKKEKLRELEVSYDDKKDEYYQLKTKSDETNNRMNIIEERKKNLKREKNELTIELKKIKKETEQKEDRLSSLRKTIKNEKNKYNLWAEKKDGVEQDYQTRIELLKQLRSKLNKYRENLIKENVDINQLKRDFDKIEEKIKYKERIISDLRDQKEQVMTDQARLNNKLETNKKNITETNKKLENKKEEIEELTTNLEKFQKKYNKLQDRYEDIQSKLYQKKSRKEFVEDLKKEYSGFYKGVKSLLKNKKKFPKMYGAVAELITVKNGYERAIEKSLGSRLQNIIVEDDQTAKRCIEYLKNNNSGRATFLPLKSIKSYGRIKTDKFNNLTGYLGLAVDFVKSDKKYKAVMEYLLAKTIITKDLDPAIEISDQVNKKYKIVTLEGDLIYPGGSVSGGSSEDKKNDLLNREKEISDLEEEIEQLDNNIDEIVKKGLEAKDNIERLTEKKEKSENDFQKLRLELDNYKENKKDLEEKISEIKSEVQTIKEKIESELGELKQLKEKKNNLNELFEKNSQDFDQEQEIIDKKQTEIDDLSHEIENLREKLTEVRVNHATQQEKLKNLKKELQNLKETVEKNKDEIRDKNKRVDEIKNEVSNLTKRKEKLIKQREEFKQKVHTADEQLKKLKEDLEQKRSEHQRLEEEVEGLTDKLNEKKERLHEINIEFTKKNDRIESIEKRLFNEYDFDIKQDEYQNRQTVQNPQEVEKEVKKLRNEISRLGSVNLGAIKEHEELKERLDYLHEQQDDLNEAKESIINIINRIEETMMEKFKTSFYQIKEQFEHLFVELFNGGRAELNLVDEEQLLETGVEIIAQPPGKKLKKLTLLSGGERALTAIALVFALLKVNPSPFYILDEIDAPLDDVNVVRFSEFLKKYTDFAQFIVVTHRKHMMTAVDNIYGLTMTDRGVTELVSLNLKEQIQ